jgi:hypothetical protein
LIGSRMSSNRIFAFGMDPGVEIFELLSLR